MCFAFAAAFWPRLFICSGKGLTEVPAYLFRLDHITALDLSCVSLFSSPSRRRVMRCVRCERVVVVFSYNKLTSLPNSLGNLKHLTELYLACVSPSSSPPRCRATHCMRCMRVVVVSQPEPSLVPFRLFRQSDAVDHAGAAVRVVASSLPRLLSVFFIPAVPCCVC